MASKNARPCDVAWLRSLRDQCAAAGVPCFTKQMGRWIAGDHTGFKGIGRWLLENGATWVPPVSGPASRERPLNAVAFGIEDPKGGKMEAWPIDLQVREYPEATGGT